MGLAFLQDPQIYIGEGSVFHARPARLPRVKGNSFRYSLFNLIIPITATSSNPELHDYPLFSVAAHDYLDGAQGNLRTSIQEFLKEELAYTCDSIWLQTLPKILGYSFHPVSFWYCYKGTALDAVLCEVNNTFGDRHFYFVRDLQTTSKIQSVLPKRFHVSPFLPIKGHYKFDFTQTDNTLDVRIQLLEETVLQLDTRITLKVRPLSAVSNLYLLKTYGWMTAMIIFRIHYQAIKLWFKGASFFSRPEPPKERVTL